MHDARSALDTRITFDIRRKRYNKKSTYMTAKAEGSVIPDGGAGLTIVRGQVKFGRVYYANLLLIPVFFVLFFVLWNLDTLPGRNSPSFQIAPFWIIFSLIVVWHRWILFKDRNGLITDIAAALETRKGKAK